MRDQIIQRQNERSAGADSEDGELPRVKHCFHGASLQVEVQGPCKSQELYRETKASDKLFFFV